MRDKEVGTLVILILAILIFSFTFSNFINIRITGNVVNGGITGFGTATNIIISNYWAPITYSAVTCYDSDNGKDYYIAGYITIGSTRYDDLCTSQTKLREYYCFNNNKKYVNFNCPYGCSQGRCNTAPTCTAGWKCKDTSTLAYQNTDCTWTSLTPCTYGCLDNACSQGSSIEIIKGMRFDPSYYYNKGYSAATLAAKIASDAQTNGVNTIFMYSYNPTYGAFYKTTYQDTAVEGGFGSQDMLKELISAAHAKNIKVVAWLPVNNFKKVWDNHADWREKTKSGTDYKPATDLYLLSPLHDSFQTWYQGFLNDLLTTYPGIDGIEAAEGVIDWTWDWSVDYNPVANQKYLAAYPSGTLGDANWKIFRASGMTKLHQILIQVAHSKSKQAYVVQTWSSKSDGHLMLSSAIRDGSGFDFDGIMNLADKPNYIAAELIWQEQASNYNNPTIFTPDWTKQATEEFITNVNKRTNAIVHVELSTFGAYTPTNAQFQTSLQHALTGTQGADFYDHNLVETKAAWPNVKAVYSTVI
ncbi:family 10 glycosylhydrolase [Candidatus Pacearchaeota archaeon]|nr:family 10 glycosylhydrolase [Candidatus Pacearchaeota archaeon]